MGTANGLYRPQFCTAPSQVKTPPGLKASVLRFKKAHPSWGTRRLVYELRPYFQDLKRGVVCHILRVNKKTWQRLKKQPRPHHPIPVGRHRAQLDMQQLPAVAGQHGYEYKISIIHLRTRIKYSEIHTNHKGVTIGSVVRRAQDILPPFRLVWTDNALEFTRRGRGHTDRPTPFEEAMAERHLKHATCALRSPWQNGIIERSHRTDNEEVFSQFHFTDPEERRYIHRLWEMEYNTHRPHQGLDGDTPLLRYQKDYRLHATARMLGYGT